MNTPHDAALESLLLHLRDPDETKRRQAVEDLADLHDPRSIAGLVSLLEHENNLGVVEAIANTLVLIGGREVVCAILPLLRSGEAKIRNLVCEILVSIGTDALDCMLQLLQDPDEDIRKFVVDMLGEMRSAGAVPALLPLLNDASVNVASAAAETLGKIGDRQAAQPLMAAIREHSVDLAYYGMLALGKLRDPAARDFLVSYTMPGGDEMLCAAALEALGDQGMRSASPAIVPFLDSANPALQKTALKALGKIDLRDLEGAFKGTAAPARRDLAIALLNDADQQVRQYALIALGVVGAVAGVESLVALLEKNDELLPFVMQVLVKMGKIDGSFIGPLRENPAIRAMVPTIVADIQNEALVPVITSLLTDPDAVVRRSAVRALGKFRTAGIAALLMERLQDTDNTVRGAAADSLGWLRAADAAAQLGALFEDNYVDVIESAAGALVMIGGEIAEQVILPFATHARPEVREKAVQALGMIAPSAGVRQALLRALADRAAGVRRLAIFSLAKSGGDDLAAALKPLAADPDSLVRAAVVKTLARLRSAAVREILLETVGDTDVWVRYESLRALGQFADEVSAGKLLSALVAGENIEQIAACESLAMQGYRPAEAGLRGMLKSDDPDVRKAAQAALQKLGLADGMTV